MIGLEIRDGNPWWLSPDVWVVPGDPNGNPGQPVVGEPAFPAARVRNGLDVKVNDATVQFYWGSPSTAFRRTSGTTPIGTAAVTLAPGAEADVLCLTPWVPTSAQAGHECVLAEVFHPQLDPLPPTAEFNVPTDPHVAQRNLTVLRGRIDFFRTVLAVINVGREDAVFTVQAVPTDLLTLEPLVATAGLPADVLRAGGEFMRVGLVEGTSPDEADIERARPVLEDLRMGPGERRKVTVVGKLQGTAALVDVVQFAADGQPVGGLSVLVLHDTEQE